MNGSIHVRLRLVLLIAANLLVPLFFLSRLEAQVVVGALLAGAILMTILTGRYGFTPLLSLCHVFWIPLLLFLRCGLVTFPQILSSAFGFGFSSNSTRCRCSSTLSRSAATLSVTASKPWKASSRTRANLTRHSIGVASAPCKS